MANSLYVQVARRVLNETLSVRRGDAVTVESWNNGLDVAKAVVAEARAMGCTAILLLEDEEAYVDGVRRSPRDTLGKMGRNEYALLEGTDAYVFIPGPLIAAYQTRVDPRLITKSTDYNDSWYKAAEKAKLKGARLAFGYVGEEVAGIMGRTVEEVKERQLKAALVDLKEIAKATRRLSSALSGGSASNLRARGSHLEFKLKGEANVEDGVVSAKDMKRGENMTYVPPGFVSIDVDPSSARGTIAVSKSLTRLGVLEDAKLTFEDGRLVKWKSKRSSAMLDKLVGAVAETKRRPTLMSIGVNPRMDYLFGQDRMVAGSVVMSGFGFAAVVRGADLEVGGREVVTNGKL